MPGSLAAPAALPSAPWRRHAGVFWSAAGSGAPRRFGFARSPPPLSSRPSPDRGADATFAADSPSKAPPPLRFGGALQDAGVFWSAAGSGAPRRFGFVQNPPPRSPRPSPDR